MFDMGNNMFTIIMGLCWGGDMSGSCHMAGLVVARTIPPRIASPRAVTFKGATQARYLQIDNKALA